MASAASNMTVTFDPKAIKTMERLARAIEEQNRLTKAEIRRSNAHTDIKIPNTED